MRLMERFGWTPQELDEIDGLTINKLIQMLGLEAQLNKDRK